MRERRWRMDMYETISYVIVDKSGQYERCEDFEDHEVMRTELLGMIE